jgi:hypothetical protein
MGRKIITWDVGKEGEATAHQYLSQCLRHFNSMIRSQEQFSGFREVHSRNSLSMFHSLLLQFCAQEAQRRLDLFEAANGYSLRDNDTHSSPILRPRSVPIGLLQSRDCIIAVQSAAELAQQLKDHAGKVSCVITAFGTCRALQAELGHSMYESAHKDKVRGRLCCVSGCWQRFCLSHRGCFSACPQNTLTSHLFRPVL